MTFETCGKWFCGRDSRDTLFIYYISVFAEIVGIFVFTNMGILEANIYLDNEFNTYYSGQTVNGRIEYVFDSPKYVRGIHVKFKGEAHTEWAESEQQENSQGSAESTDTFTPTHTGHEEYFQISYYVLGSNAGCNEIEIPAGKHVYNFTCALPPVLPSSFEGEYGYIRYTVKVVLVRPWKFDQETKMAFTVIDVFDLNLNPSYKEPIHIQMEKTFCCFCCTSLPLSVDVQAPVSGYCPGQVLPIRIYVENKSNVEVDFVKIFIRKIVKYRSTLPSDATKTVKDIVLTSQEGPVPAGVIKIYNLNVEVPPIPPSDLVNCNIIDLDYDFKVKCSVSGMHTGLSGKQYIAIGTVPLVAIQAGPLAPASSGGGQYSPSQPAVLPVSPRQPAQPNPSSAPSGDPSAPGGWVIPGSVPDQPPFQILYPTLSEPVLKESSYTARTLQERGESAYVMISGPRHFAPNYPTYPAVKLPPLPRLIL